MKVRPDLEFVQDVARDSGNESLTCQQCATCSVMCPLSPVDQPYPRKEMMWAAWGMKEQCFGDPDIWLCHQCGDCATHCTRGAKPSDVLAGLRLQAIQHFAVPSIMGRMVREPKFLPVLLLISGTFLTLLLLLQQIWVGDTPLLMHGVHFEYEEFLAHRTINTLFPLAFFTAVGCAAVGALRHWRAMERVAGDWGSEEKQGLIGAFIGAAIDLLLHNRFHRCEAARPRWSGHLMVFYGFVGLLIVTAIATVLTVLEHLPSHPDLYPLGWLHPVKIMGNAAGVVMVGGSLYVIWYRLTHPEQLGKTTYSDWFFVVVLLVVGLSGFGTEFIRLTPLPAVLGTPIYLVHLLSVFWLLIFFPYSKFAHAMYRFVAMAFARRIGRPLPQPR